MARPTTDPDRDVAPSWPCPASSAISPERVALCPLQERSGVEARRWRREHERRRAARRADALRLAVLVDVRASRARRSRPAAAATPGTVRTRASTAGRERLREAAALFSLTVRSSTTTSFLAFDGVEDLAERAVDLPGHARTCPRSSRRRARSRARSGSRAAGASAGSRASGRSIGRYSRDLIWSRISSALMRARSATISPSLEEHDAVGDRRRAGVVGDDHDRLPELGGRRCASGRGSRRSSWSRGCRSARRRRRRPAC